MYKKVIGIYGVPRSGTSWLGEIFNSCENLTYKFQPQFSYKFKNRITEVSPLQEIEACFNEMIFCEDAFLDQKEQRAAGRLPTFSKANNAFDILTYKEVRYLYTIDNILAQCPNFLLIGIVRNPIHTLNSWLNAPKEYNSNWDVAEQWRDAPLKNQELRENFYGYNKWKEAFKLLIEMENKYKGQVYLVKYEDIVSNVINQTIKMFQFCDIPFGEQTIKFISESQKRTINDAYAVYRNKNENKHYKIYLSKDIIDEIKLDLENEDIIKKYYSLL